MKKTYLIILAFISVHLVYGQTEITRDVISNGGGNQITGSLELSWTLGELAVDTKSESAIEIYEGIQQGDFDFLISTKELVQEFEFFPNPTNHALTIRSEFREAIAVNLFNILGEKIISDEINLGTKEHIIALDQLPSGSYVLNFQNIKGETKSYIIQKI